MASGAGFNILSSAIRAGGRAAWSLLIPVLLSVEHFAGYSLWQTTTMILAYLGVLGMPQLIMREPKHSVPIVGLLLHAVALITVGVVIVSIVTPRQHPLFYPAVFVGGVATAGGLVLTARAKGSLEFSAVAVSEATTAGVLLLVGVPALFLVRSHPANDYLVAIAIEIAAMLPAFVLLTKGRFRLHASERSLFGTASRLRSVYSIGIIAVVDILLWRRIEVYFLAPGANGMRDIAAFSLSVQISALFMLVPGAIVEAWYPSVAAAHREGPGALAALWRTRMKAYAAGYLALLVVCVPTLIAMVEIVFRKYSSALVPMCVLVFVRVGSGYFGIYSSMLYASGRERWLYPNIAVGTVCSLAGNILLTIPLGLWGAVLAYGITQVAVGLMTFIVWRKAQAC